MLSHTRVFAALATAVCLIYMVTLCLLIAPPTWFVEDHVLNVSETEELELMARHDRFTERAYYNYIGSAPTPTRRVMPSSLPQQQQQQQRRDPLCPRFPPEAQLPHDLCAPWFVVVSPEEGGGDLMAEKLRECHGKISDTIVPLEDDRFLTGSLTLQTWKVMAKQSPKASDGHVQVTDGGLVPHDLYRLQPASLEKLHRQMPHLRPVFVLRDPREQCYEYYLNRLEGDPILFEAYLEENYKDRTWAARGPGDYYDSDDWMSASMRKLELLIMASSQGLIPPQIITATPHNPMRPYRFEGWKAAQSIGAWTRQFPTVSMTVVIYEDGDTIDNHLFTENLLLDSPSTTCRLPNHPNAYTPMSDRARTLLTHLFRPSVEELYESLDPPTAAKLKHTWSDFW